MTNEQAKLNNKIYYENEIKKYQKLIEKVEKSIDPAIIAHKDFLKKKYQQWISIYNGYLIKLGYKENI